MNSMLKGFSAGLCLAVLVGCSSGPASNSPSPVASAASSAPASPASTPSVNPRATIAAPAQTPSGGLTPQTNDKEETVSHAKAGFKVTIPAGWQSVKKENMLVMSTADEACMVLFLTQSDTNDHDVTKDLDKLLGNMMTDVKQEGSNKDVDTNGMKGTNTTGTGKMGGKDMVWSLDVIQSKQPFVMVLVFDPAKIDPHKADMMKIGPSIQPIKE